MIIRPVKLFSDSAEFNLDYFNIYFDCKTSLITIVTSVFSTFLNFHDSYIDTDLKTIGDNFSKLIFSDDSFSDFYHLLLSIYDINGALENV